MEHLSRHSDIQDDDIIRLRGVESSGTEVWAHEFQPVRMHKLQVLVLLDPHVFLCYLEHACNTCVPVGGMLHARLAEVDRRGPGNQE